MKKMHEFYGKTLASLDVPYSEDYFDTSFGKTHCLLVGDPEKLVNWDGAYYQEKILPEHTVKTNDKVLNRITLGKITVNYE